MAVMGDETVELLRRRAPAFWRRVDKDDVDSCWPWTGYVSPAGYGQFWGGKGSVKAHRFSYELNVGPIPEGLQIEHLCRNRACVRPSHLEAVLPRVNRQRSTRGETPGR